MLLYTHMDGEHYGLSLGRDLKISDGALYPALTKLEKMKLITATWEDIDPQKEGRRPRRYYRLTADGISTFERERSALWSSQGGLTHV